MMTEEGTTKIVNSMPPGVEVIVLRCSRISCIVKIHYFFIHLLYFQAQIRRTEDIIMISEVFSTKIVNLITHGEGVLVLGCGHIVSMHYFFSSSCLN